MVIFHNFFISLNVKYTYDQEQCLKYSTATHGNNILLEINKILAIYQMQKTVHFRSAFSLFSAIKCFGGANFVLVDQTGKPGQYL